MKIIATDVSHFMSCYIYRERKFLHGLILIDNGEIGWSDNFV